MSALNSTALRLLMVLCRAEPAEVSATPLREADWSALMALHNTGMVDFPVGLRGMGNPPLDLAVVTPLGKRTLAIVEDLFGTMLKVEAARVLHKLNPPV